MQYEKDSERKMFISSAKQVQEKDGAYYDSAYYSSLKNTRERSTDQVCTSTTFLGSKDIQENGSVESSSYNNKSCFSNELLLKSFNLLQNFKNLKQTPWRIPSEPQALKEENSSKWSVSKNSQKTLRLSSLFTPVSSLSSKKIVSYGTTVKRIAPVKFIWENPVVGVNDQLSLPAISSKRILSKKSFKKIFSSFTFNKEMLKHVYIIGQVDHKFIACIFKGKKDLVLVDQHAAHERIRLEKLLQQIGYYKKETDAIKNQVTKLSPPLHLCLCKNDFDLLNHYRMEFQSIGLFFTSNEIKNKEVFRIYISSIPSVFVNVCEKQVLAKGSDINAELIKEFILEQIQIMRTCTGSTNLSSVVVFKALASYACHGAIKFGDSLTWNTCVTIVEQLAKCNLPFQCAHGRPSVAPLFRLGVLKDMYRHVYHKPNLKRLKR